MTTPLFTTLHHVTIVVRDMARAVAFYKSVGIGPWHDFPPLTAFAHDLVVPDRDDFLALEYRYADLGNVQLQLVAPGEGDTPQRRFLEQYGEGVFHLGFSVPDIDDAEAWGNGQGLDVLLHGRKADGKGFTYFDTRERGAAVVLQVRSAS